MRLAIALLLPALLVAAGCGGSGPDPRIADPPVGARSAFPRLASSPDGRLRLLWIDAPEEGGASLRLATFEAATGWGEPLSVGDAPVRVAWNDPPALLLRDDGAAVAAWSAPPDRGGRGVTWRATAVGESDAGLGARETRAQYARPALVATPAGTAASWLDGEGTVRLLFGVLAPGAAPEGELVDDDVCPCAPAALAVAAHGRVLVAYRDRLADGSRDVVVRARGRDGFGEPVRVDRAGWRAGGCPADGPALAAGADRVLVAWFTRAGDEPRVLVAGSTDGGASFGAPRRIDGGDPIGRVDVAIDEAGRAVVSWLEADGVQARIRVLALDGQAEPLDAGRTVAGPESGTPRLAIAGDAVVVAWTETIPRPRVRLAALPLSGP